MKPLNTYILEKNFKFKINRNSILDEPGKKCLVLCFIQGVKSLSEENVVEMYIGDWKESDLEYSIEISVHDDHSEKFVNITGDNEHILSKFVTSSGLEEPFYEKTIKAYGGGTVTIIPMFEYSAKEILENLYKDPEYKLDLEEYLMNGDGYANIMLRLRDKEYVFYEKDEILDMLNKIE